MAEPRLLLHPDRPGAWQMACDEVLLRAAADSPPALRVYSWRPACLTLGYGQSHHGIDLPACRAAGVDVTRRLTGGRAVLHHLEWTYSLILSADQLGCGRSVAAAYAKLSGGLAAGLERLGLAAGCTPRARADAPGDEAACFASTIGGDLSVGGRKLVGSAQCHRHGGVLQHGSIPIAVDEALLATCLGRPVARGWTCLGELGVSVDLPTLAAALADGLAPILGGRPRPGELTAAEEAATAALAADVYAGDAWLTRR